MKNQYCENVPVPDANNIHHADGFGPGTELIFSEICFSILKDFKIAMFKLNLPVKTVTILQLLGLKDSMKREKKKIRSYKNKIKCPTKFSRRGKRKYVTNKIQDCPSWNCQ